MSITRRLWLALRLLLGTTFAVLLWMGREIHRAAKRMVQAHASGAETPAHALSARQQD